MQYIMSLDQGTTSSRCILFDKNGAAVSTAQKEYRQIYPQPGWVEHDPMEIWQSQLEVAQKALAQKGPLTLPPSASPTSEKPQSSGTSAQASPFTTPLYGSAAGQPRTAKNWRKKATPTYSGKKQGFCWTHTSPQQKSVGC